MQSSLVIFRVLSKLLRGLQISVTDELLRNLIYGQLYHGSIRTITEILNELSIASKVYQLEENDLHELEFPVIVHFKESENKFVVADELHSEQIRYYDPIADKYIWEEKTLFFEKWTGVVLIPFTDEQSGDPDYAKHVKEEREKKLIHKGIYTGISFAVVLLLTQTIYVHPENWLIWFGLMIFKLIGLLVVSQIVKIELGETNPFITKICKTTDCGKVLNSKASKLFSWLTMGDVGMMYFGYGFLLLIMAPFHTDLKNIVFFLFFLNLFTLPYTLFSIIYQRFIFKTWCPFCLTVVGMLWAEFFLGLTVHWTEVFPLSTLLLLQFGFIGISATVVWYVVKKLLIEKKISHSIRTYVNMVKKDTDLFKAVISNQDSIPIFSSSFEIVLGNEDAQNVLIAVISTNCPSCAALYQSIQRFLTFHSDELKVIIRFKPGDRDDGWENQIIDYMLTFNMKNIKERALSILEECYHMENREIHVWKRKYNLDEIVVLDEAKQMRKDYQNWLLSTNIQGAPAMILNNKLVPLFYTFDDVKYFLKRI